MSVSLSVQHEGGFVGYEHRPGTPRSALGRMKGCLNGTGMVLGERCLNYEAELCGTKARSWIPLIFKLMSSQGLCLSCLERRWL